MKWQADHAWYCRVTWLFLKGATWVAETNASSAAAAGRMFAQQFDSGVVQCIDHFCYAIDDAPHVALAGLHSLNCWKGNPRHLRHGFLVDFEQCAGCAKLVGGNHE